MSSGYDKYFKTARAQTPESTVEKNVRNHAQRVSHAAGARSSASSTPHSTDRKLSRPKTAKKPFPVGSMVLFMCFIIGLGVSIQYLDQIEQFLTDLEISMSTADAADGVTAAAAPGGVPSTASAGTSTAGANNSAAATGASDPKNNAAAGGSDDSTDYLFKLAERKRELDQREEDIKRREEQVTKMKEEIEAKLKEIQNYRNNIAVLLRDRVATDSAKVDTLVQVYSNMKPAQAAKVFETMDEDLVIEILGKMKKKSAADILNLVKAEKAQVLAEKFAGYRLSERKVASDDSENSNVNQSKEEPIKKEDSEE